MSRRARAVGVIYGLLVSGVAIAADLKVETVQPEAPAALPWTLSTSSELSYSFFSGSRAYPAAAATNVNRGSGNQVYLDTSYALAGNPSEDLKLEFLLKSGMVKSEQTTGGFTGRYRGPTDTIFSGTATYLGIDGVQPYLALNFNLPTGQAALLGTAGRARLDPDLVPVPTFGEGFNFGPTIGVNIPFTPNLVFNVSGGLTVREAYNREGTFVPSLALPGAQVQLLSKYTPGLLTSLSTSVTYSEGAFSGQLSAAYNGDTTAKVDNIATSRSGNRFTFGLVTSYTLTDALSVAFNGTASFARSNYGVHPDVVVPVSAILSQRRRVVPEWRTDAGGSQLQQQGLPGKGQRDLCPHVAIVGDAVRERPLPRQERV